MENAYTWKKKKEKKKHKLITKSKMQKYCGCNNIYIYVCVDTAIL